MTVQYPNILPQPTDGVTYFQGALPAAEADLGSPVALPYAAAVVASVEFSAPGGPGGTAYVVLQTDLGDGVFFDIAWVQWSVVAAGGNFLISGGVAGANAFQQTRAVGSAPGSSGSNQCPFGARFRFVGKWSGGSSSSSSSPGGLAPVGQVSVSIKYKVLGLR